MYWLHRNKANHHKVKVADLIYRVPLIADKVTWTIATTQERAFIGPGILRPSAARKLNWADHRFLENRFLIFVVTTVDRTVKFFTCKRGAAELIVTGNFTCLWETCNFRLPAENKPIDRSMWQFAYLIASIRSSNQMCLKMFRIGWQGTALQICEYALCHFSLGFSTLQNPFLPQMLNFLPKQVPRITFNDERQMKNFNEPPTHKICIERSTDDIIFDQVRVTEPECQPL